MAEFLTNNGKGARGQGDKGTRGQGERHYSSDKTKRLVETAIYRVSKTQNFCLMTNPLGNQAALSLQTNIPLASEYLVSVEQN